MKCRRITAGVLAVLLVTAMKVQSSAAQCGYHQPYLTGYPDGSIRPEAEVTREELAQILLRLMEKEPKQMQTESRFCDVSEDRWSYSAISALAGLSVMPGDITGKYGPKKTVSGMALTVILDRIAYTGAADCYPTLAEQWSVQRENVAEKLMQMETVQRAEIAALLNLLLGRKTESDCQMGSAEFSDNADAAKWFYADIREAATPHSWEKKAAEVWTAVG